MYDALSSDSAAKDPFATKQDKAEPHYVNPADLAAADWKSSDGMYPDNRGGFNKKDRSLWRKDRYNAVFGRFRDRNGEYRNKKGHRLGEDNVPLLSFNDDKPFTGWANDPGSQFHPADHPKVDADFYRNRENWPCKGMRALALHPFEGDWDEKGVPLKNEFLDLSTLPAFSGLNQKQLPERVPMDKVFELQQQALNNQAHAVQQQAQGNNAVQQIGSLVQTAAPLVMQGLSALASAASGGGERSKRKMSAGARGAAAMKSATAAESGTPDKKIWIHRKEDGKIRNRTWEHRHTDPVPQTALFSDGGPATSEGGSVESGSAGGGSVGPEASSGGVTSLPGGGGGGGGTGGTDVVSSSGGITGSGLFVTHEGASGIADPNYASPDGMYGPMYPEPGIMTDQPQGEITSGRPEVEYADSNGPFQTVREHPSRPPESASEPSAPSAVDKIVDGVWEALTKGSEGAGKAFEGLADNADKIVDGAKLGGKMAVPVLEHAGKEALKDAVLSYLSQYGWGIFKLAADFEGGQEMQITKGVSEAQGKAREIAAEIRAIVENYEK